jgi:hypothetical protein
LAVVGLEEVFEPVGARVDTDPGTLVSTNRACVVRGGMTVENRRRAERQDAVWMGSCHVEDEASDAWRDCGVFDFSALGAGMDLRHPDSTDLVGRRLSVRLPVGASTDIILTGDVRNAKGGPDGIVRLGIEFVGLSEIERSVIDLLERRDVGKPKGA